MKFSSQQEKIVLIPEVSRYLIHEHVVMFYIFTTTLWRAASSGGVQYSSETAASMVDYVSRTTRNRAVEFPISESRARHLAEILCDVEYIPDFGEKRILTAQEAGQHILDELTVRSAVRELDGAIPGDFRALD